MTGDASVHFDQIHNGDELTVTLRGTAEEVSDSTGSFYIAGGTDYGVFITRETYESGLIVDIQRHEPVITFEAGEIIESKGFPGYQYVVLKGNRFVSLTDGDIFTGPATSEEYEKVN